MDGWMDNSMI